MFFKVVCSYHSNLSCREVDVVVGWTVKQVRRLISTPIFRAMEHGHVAQVRDTRHWAPWSLEIAGPCLIARLSSHGQPAPRRWHPALPAPSGTSWPRVG